MVSAPDANAIHVLAETHTHTCPNWLATRKTPAASSRPALILGARLAVKFYERETCAKNMRRRLIILIN
jgi:hypothetical protein